MSGELRRRRCASSSERNFSIGLGEPTLDLFSLGVGEADRMGVLLLHLDQETWATSFWRSSGQVSTRSKTSLSILLAMTVL